MAASKTEICNLALGHLGHSKRLSNVDTDTTPLGSACKLYYDYALRSTLRDYDWPFASKTLPLAFVADNPTPQWVKSFRYPADCVKFQKILSAQTIDSADTKVPYEESSDASGLLIFCAAATPYAKYTSYVTSVAYYPPDFVLALSYLLAAMIAPSVTSGDDFKLGQTAMQLYRMFISKANANAQNEIQSEIDPDSEYTRAR